MVTIHPEDRSVETERRNGTLPPLRDLTGFEPLADFRESERREYQR